MTINYESENLALRLWFMIHRTHDMLKMCEDQVFGEYKLTTMQYVVLVAIKYLGSHVRPTDVARWLGRSPNSVSMIADRMVKAGLLRRVRDKGDRRAVFLIITSKGEKALKPAILAGWEFIQKILSPLSYDDKQTLLGPLLTIQYGAYRHLNPGEDIEKLMSNEAESHANLMERLCQYIPTSTPEAKRQGGEKGETI